MDPLFDFRVEVLSPTQGHFFWKVPTAYLIGIKKVDRMIIIGSWNPCNFIKSNK